MWGKIYLGLSGICWDEVGRAAHRGPAAAGCAGRGDGISVLAGRCARDGSILFLMDIYQSCSVFQSCGELWYVVVGAGVGVEFLEIHVVRLDADGSCVLRTRGLFGGLRPVVETTGYERAPCRAGIWGGVIPSRLVQPYPTALGWLMSPVLV